MSPAKLLTDLAAAFPRRPFDASTFARANGSWDAYTKAESFDADSQGRSWDMLGSAFVDAHGGALFFLNPDAFVAILPAYLAALLRGDTESEVAAFVLSQLTREARPEKFDTRLALLSRDQRIMVARILSALGETDPWSRYRPEIEVALASWPVRGSD